MSNQKQNYDLNTAAEGNVKSGTWAALLKLINLLRAKSRLSRLDVRAEGGAKNQRCHCQFHCTDSNVSIAARPLASDVSQQMYMAA